MSNKDLVLATMRKYGLYVAKNLQEESPTMTGTELNAQDDFIPDFVAAKAAKNMLERPVGFVCKSSASRVVKLLQCYDSEIYPGEPETLPSQWGFVWSDDPKKATAFICLATSPYMIGNCCTENGCVYRSLANNNVWSPSEYPAYWEPVANT